LTPNHIFFKLSLDPEVQNLKAFQKYLYYCVVEFINFVYQKHPPTPTLPLEGGGQGGGDSLGYEFEVNGFFWLRLRRTVFSVSLW